ncbi:hypothetical protein A2U01_0035427 [Trifolium medium]|uniref:Uncharacterized protein n=1 Tax=Trifolium medium TaxID=97028 RepID=A0A392PRL4_9FABA|nr:hypothetical protein [Trifolium medium]
MLTLLQQQAARHSYVEQNQQTAPQMVNKHVQNGFHNVLQDEVSSQQRRTGQRGPQTEAIGNSNRANNENGRRGLNSPNPHSSDNGSSRDFPYEDERRRELNRHPGRTPFTLKILESRIPKTLKKPPKLETYDGTTEPDEHLEQQSTDSSCSLSKVPP